LTNPNPCVFAAFAMMMMMIIMINDDINNTFSFVASKRKAAHYLSGIG
jgi:NADH:ubiquinone oxidoreductase subunit H